MVTTTQIAPALLVKRITAELQANPDAHRLLLRVLLTNEFQGRPAGLDSIAQDIAELNAAVKPRKINSFRAASLERRLDRHIRLLVERSLPLRNLSIAQNPVQGRQGEFADLLEAICNCGLTSNEQDAHIEGTEFIIHAWRSSDGAPVWVPVVTAIKINAQDIQRARECADILAAVLRIPAIPVVAGYRIDLPDLDRAIAAGVRYVPADEDSVP